MSLENLSFQIFVHIQINIFLDFYYQYYTEVTCTIYVKSVKLIVLLVELG